jgi:predicted GTPase
MRREIASLTLRAVAYAVPAVVVASLGLLWLFEHEQWLPFGLAIAAATGVLLVLSKILTRPVGRRAATPPPGAMWPDAGSQAWADVDRIAARVAAAPPPFGDMTAYQAIAMEILDTVGHHFHPGSDVPRLELTLAQTLAIGERVLRDLRSEVLDAVPAGRSVTLAHLDLVRRAGAYVPQAASATRDALLANRIRRWIVAWPVALAYEVVSLFDVSPAAVARRQINAITAELFVRRVGAYAIEAFADRAAIDPAAIEAVAKTKPLRILVLGPLNAGKSSLLNAMFGQERSKRDILPCPGLHEEHVLDRDGAPQAVVLDSDGFGGTGDEAARHKLFEAIVSVDIIIAVTSARQAARQHECTMLDQVRTRFARSPRRTCPPILVAATHIDLLRPAREWHPPYDFLDGDSPKEQSIRQAIDAIATDMQVPLDRVIPVSLLPGADYNVEEGLLPALGVALADADRAKFLRIVEETRSAESRDRIGKSITLLAAAGRRIVDSLSR